MEGGGRERWGNVFWGQKNRKQGTYRNRSGHVTGDTNVSRNGYAADLTAGSTEERRKKEAEDLGAQQAAGECSTTRQLGTSKQPSEQRVSRAFKGDKVEVFISPPILPASNTLSTLALFTSCLESLQIQPTTKLATAIRSRRTLDLWNPNHCLPSHLRC